jgi:hypothetical protein
MLRDPCRSPCAIAPPKIGVELEYTVVERGDREIGDPVYAFCAAVPVGAIADIVRRDKKAFVAESHEVVLVEAFDVF